MTCNSNFSSPPRIGSLGILQGAEAGSFLEHVYGSSGSGPDVRSSWGRSQRGKASNHRFGKASETNGSGGICGRSISSDIIIYIYNIYIYISCILIWYDTIYIVFSYSGYKTLTNWDAHTRIYLNICYAASPVFTTLARVNHGLVVWGVIYWAVNEGTYHQLGHCFSGRLGLNYIKPCSYIIYKILNHIKPLNHRITSSRIKPVNAGAIAFCMFTRPGNFHSSCHSRLTWFRCLRETAWIDVLLWRGATPGWSWLGVLVRSPESGSLW